MLTVDWSKNRATTEQRESHGYTVGIYMLMTGIPVIETAAHVAEMVARVRFYNRLMQVDDATCRDLESVDFWTKTWAPIRVNGNKETRSAWRKRITDSSFSEIDYAIRQAL